MAQQHQGHAGDSASVWSLAIRRGSGFALRTLIGTGCNPNVAAVVVIGIEDGWTKKVVDGIAKSGKPVVGFGIEGHGDHETIMKALKGARVVGRLRKASRAMQDRRAVGSTKCGESGHHVRRGANPTVGNA